MLAQRLVSYQLLDTRTAETAQENPILQAVNIPFVELEARMHELPPRDEVIPVTATGAVAKESVAFLIRQGRKAVLESDYQVGKPPPYEQGRLWRPNAFLMEQLDSLFPDLPDEPRALDIGCGSGRDAVCLATHGWRVTAIDRLPDALERGIDLEARYSPDALPIEWIAHDLDDSLPSFKHSFHLITCFFYLNRPLLEQAHRWLKPRGILIMETFTRTHRSRFGKPSSDHLTVAEGEESTILPGLQPIWAERAWHGKRHTLQLLAIRK